MAHHQTVYSDILKHVRQTYNMSVSQFTDLVDTGALGVEFYYFCRELMRAQHKLLGMLPGPSTSLLPTGYVLDTLPGSS